MFATGVSGANSLNGVAFPANIGGSLPREVAPATADWASTASRTTAVRADAPAQLLAQGAGVSRETAAARVNAQFAVDVYRTEADSRPPAGWRVAGDGDLNALNLSPGDLRSSDGNFQARVYVQGSGDNVTYVIAFRGTRMDQTADWANNARQGVGLESAYYNNALRIGQRVAQSDERVMMTGHSLGGGLASAAALASGRQADTFNAAGLSNRTIDLARASTREAGRSEAQIDAYYVRGEVLSAFQDGGDRQVGAGLGGILLGPVGSSLGRLAADAPSAYGTRRELPVVAPGGDAPARPNRVDLHGMNFVQAALARAD